MSPRRSTRGLLAALSMMGAGLIHLAAIRSHLGSPTAVASFTGIGIIQILLGASLLQPGNLRFKRAVVVGVGVLTLGAWLVSRTWGLPAMSGHIGAEPVRAADLAAASLELTSLALILLPTRSPRKHVSHPITRAMTALPIIAVTAFVSLSLLSVSAHSHVPATTGARPAEYVTERKLVKRPVPLPAKSAPALESHVDEPGTSAHSH